MTCCDVHSYSSTYPALPVAASGLVSSGPGSSRREGSPRTASSVSEGQSRRFAVTCCCASPLRRDAAPLPS